MIVSLIAAAAALSAPTDPGKHLAELRHIYSQSCEVRAYATFDRLCAGLKKQMRDAEKAHRQAARAQPKVEPTLALAAPAGASAQTRD